MFENFIAKRDSVHRGSQILLVDEPLTFIGGPVTQSSMHGVRRYDRLNSAPKLTSHCTCATSPLVDRNSQRFETLRNGPVRLKRNPNRDCQRVDRITVQPDELSHMCIVMRANPVSAAQGAVFLFTGRRVTLPNYRTNFRMLRRGK
jgi:hypothetical protein